jgi:hypothetical protein
MPFTIDDTNITARADMDEARNYVLETPGAQIFSSQAELNTIARSWPASRLVDARACSKRVRRSRCSPW